MRKAIFHRALAVAVLFCCLTVTGAFAGQPTPPFFAPAGAAGPAAAPNPPYIVISQAGSSALLEWDHPDPTLTVYETWRSEAPYFDPALEEGLRIGFYSFSEGIYAEFAPFSYVDNGSCGYYVAAGQQLPCAPQSPPATVTGDVSHQYFWLVRVSNGEYAESNRVGEFDFNLVKGG